MTNTEMDTIKEDIIKRIDRSESTNDVLKNSGGYAIKSLGSI